MKDSKRRLIIIIEHVLIIAALLFGFCRYSHMNDFTKSKWQEGFSGDVVYDMMENYVYPGVPLTDVVENLGSETNKIYDKEKYLSLFGLDGAEYCRGDRLNSVYICVNNTSERHYLSGSVAFLYPSRAELLRTFSRAAVQA